jgi:DNA primase
MDMAEKWLGSMNQQHVKQVKQVRLELTQFFDKVCKVYCTDSLIYELMSHRKYNSQAMFDTLKTIGMFKVDYLSDLTLVVPDVTNVQLKQWGLVSEDGNYILGGRYVVAIRDIAGNVISLVGWHPQGGSRKYVTTPTLGFSRDASFFNLDCYAHAWDKWNGTVYVVEGIFDTISLRSLGLPALGQMGLEMSPVKTQILNRFGKVVAIPDNDNSGKSVNPLTNAFSGKKKKFVWEIENESVFISLPLGVKDVDDFIVEFDCYDDLVACQTSKYIKKLKEEA